MSIKSLGMLSGTLGILLATGCYILNYPYGYLFSLALLFVALCMIKEEK